MHIQGENYVNEKIQRIIRKTLYQNSKFLYYESKIYVC